MDWFKFTITAATVFVVVGFPIQLIRAFKRHDWRRIFDLVVSVMTMVVLWTMWAGVFPPVSLHVTEPLKRWLALPVLLLFLLNMFGLSHWLFRPKAGPERRTH